MISDESAEMSDGAVKPRTRQLDKIRSSCVRRASQGPQGRVVPFGGARQGPGRRLRTAVQLSSSADRGRVPRFILGRIIIAVHRAFVSGCEGPRHRGIV